MFLKNLCTLPSDYTVVMMTSNKEFLRIWKEAVMAFVRHCPHICLEVVSTPKENVKRYLMCKLKLKTGTFQTSVYHITTTCQ